MNWYSPDFRSIPQRDAAMKITTIVSSVLLLMFMLMSPLSRSGVITFDFYDLIDHQNGNISGRLGDGSEYSGPPLAATYEYLTWDKGVTLTASTRYEPVWEGAGYDPAKYVPSYVYLQPGFSGIGTCENATCPAGHQFGYSDVLLLEFSEVVDIINIEFGNGKDESWWPTPEEWYEEHGIPFDLDEDYRAYNTHMSATGDPLGPGFSWGGSHAGWNDLLVGNQLEMYRTEGYFFLESITVRTRDVPEPPIFGLIALGLLTLFCCKVVRKMGAEGSIRDQSRFGQK